MAKTKHRSRAPLIAMADMFICVSAVFLFFLGKPDDAQRQVAARKIEVAALEKRVAELRADRDEAEADVTYVQGQVETERERLEEKQRAYQNWDVVVQQFTHYAALDREPDYHFYVRSNGVYSSASTAKWTKAGLKAWLSDVAAKTPPGSTTDVVFYIENGANDLFIYERSVIDELNASGVRIVSHSVILPPGVHAGPDEMIHANQGGGK